MKKRKFNKSTMEEVKKIRKMRKDGFNYSAIAKKVGKDRTTVLYWCEEVETGPIRKKTAKKKRVSPYFKKPDPIKKDRGKEYKDYVRSEAKKEGVDFTYRLWLRENLTK